MSKKKSLPIVIIVLAISILFIFLLMQNRSGDTQGVDTTNESSSSTSTTQDTTSTSSNTEDTNTAVAGITKATIKTSKGNIEVELRGDKAPKTVANFIKLSKDGFYNGLTFHRREEGFVIQGGDPSGNGTGGPGYTVDAEITDLLHTKGALATARLPDYVNPTKASSGSQFYITLDATPFLDGEYTVFGYVVNGMDVADKIQVGDKIVEIVIE